MSFFQSISEMLGAGDTLVVMVNKGTHGTLSLTITPKGTFKNANLGTGLNVEATPEELDRDLAAHLGRYTVARKSLQEQIEAAAVVLESASKEVATDAVKKMGAKAGATPKATTHDGKAAATPGAASGQEGGSATGTGGVETEVSLF